MPGTTDQFADFTLTYLAGGAGGVGLSLAAGDTTLYLPAGVGNGRPYPTTTSGAFWMTLGDGTTTAGSEIVKCTARSGDVCTIVRGQGGTNQAWAVGTTLRATLTAANLANLWAALAAITPAQLTGSGALPAGWTLPWSQISNRPFYNVLDYGAKGDGATDDRLAIQSALDAARLAGGGLVYFPAGTYMVSSTGHPKNNAYGVCLVPGANTTLMGTGRGSSTIKMLPTVADQSRIILNYNFDTGGDENIAITDLGFDGNAANISPAPANGQYGVVFNRARRVALTRCKFKDFYGVASSGTGETFFTDFSLGTDCTYTDCECIATYAKTASGFSANSTNLVAYSGCTSRGMAIGQGFTHNTCVGMSYSNCYAYSNGYYGFNSEFSTDVSYVNCVAGLGTTSAATYPYASGTLLGNTVANFCINGGDKVSLVNCHGHRTSPGVWIYSLAGICTIVGGSFSESNPGIKIDATSQAFVRISGSPQLTNGSSAFSINGTTMTPPGIPGALVPAVPASGSNTTNNLPFPVRVTIYGGTSVSFATDGSPSVAISGCVSVVLYPQEYLTLTYTGAPSWIWVALV